VKVVVNAGGRALYFSRRTIPYLREAASRSASEQLAAFLFLKHLGIYGFRRETLLRLVKFPVSPLDDAEKLRLDDFVSQHSSSSRESDAAPERAAAPPVRAAKTSDTTLVEKLSLSDLGLADLEGVTLSEVGTKLDLARAYMEMGDPDGARQILNEVIREGSPAQQSDARRLLSTIPG
jgi:FimV-like protein